MSKLIGIVYSPGFGGGWSTWGDPDQALDQELASAIKSGASVEDISAIASKNWPDAYQGGLSDCEVEWVEPGTLFEIYEYDGSESIRFMEDPGWQVAEPKAGKA